MNALAKLVIFSSMLHQIGFLLFSSLDFAIGTVQDAGLIFLSSMANGIANVMQDQGESEEAIISTTLALLSSGTALLGLILVLMGHFKLANAVSYLPMPVVGGYLAFIGYFCCQAGVALCISEPMVDLKDWGYLLQPKYLLLAAPGLLTALLLTWISRKATNPSSLPMTMVAIPALFYIVIYATGIGLEGAREGGWVGEVAPPVPVSDLIRLVNLSLVRWDLIYEIIWTWVGMIFVVSFASCLDGKCTNYGKTFCSLCETFCDCSPSLSNDHLLARLTQWLPFQWTWARPWIPTRSWQRLEFAIVSFPISYCFSVCFMILCLTMQTYGNFRVLTYVPIQSCRVSGLDSPDRTSFHKPSSRFGRGYIRGGSEHLFALSTSSWLGLL